MRGLIREFIETALLALLIFVGLQFSVQNFIVEGSSMEPTLEEGQHLLVNKLVYFRLDPQSLRSFLPLIGADREDSLFPFHPPRRGEVIIFRFPKDPTRDFVKRVIGVPGDFIEIRKGQVFVNDEKLDEPYVARPDRRTMSRLQVPGDFYFVMGDNRRSSNDSRDWGPVAARHMVGRAWVSYWPTDHLEILRTFRWP